MTHPDQIGVLPLLALLVIVLQLEGLKLLINLRHFPQVVGAFRRTSLGPQGGHGVSQPLHLLPGAQSGFSVLVLGEAIPAALLLMFPMVLDFALR